MLSKSSAGSPGSENDDGEELTKNMKSRRNLFYK